MVPPHVNEYIRGIRRSLLTNLGPDYAGDLYEIVTPEEFDLLNQLVMKGPAAKHVDFAVRFFCDIEGTVEWNMEICTRCDPFDYHATRDIKRPERKGRSGSLGQLDDYVLGIP